MPWIGRLAGGGWGFTTMHHRQDPMFQVCVPTLGVDGAVPLTGWEDPPPCPLQLLLGDLCGSGDPGPLVLGQHLRPK